MSGTIDLEGFRSDLHSISQNDYPRMTLLKLPFNWLIQGTPFGTPQVRGSAANVSNVANPSSITVGFPTGTIVGDFALFMVGTNSFGATPAPAGWTTNFDGGPNNLTPNSATWAGGVYNALTGGTAGIGGFSRFLISTAGLSSFTCNADLWGNGTYGRAFYDAGMNFISGDANTLTAGTPETLPGGCAFVGVSWNGSPTGGVVIVGGTAPPVTKCNLVYTKVLNAADIAAGNVTLNLLYGAGADYTIVTFIGATGGLREVDNSTANTTNVDVTTTANVLASDLIISFGSSWSGVTPAGIGLLSGTTVSLSQTNNQASVLGEQTPVAGINTVQFIVTGNGATRGQSTSVIVVSGAQFDLAGTPPPINSIPLAGPMNFLSLVSEAIDEQGNYLRSAQIGQGIAAGWLRFNGAGNAWVPMAFGDPMMRGFETAADNYTGTPITGMGFQAIESPFGRLDWQPATPVFYQGAPPVVGYVLALAGLSVGLGSDIGNGRGNTFAIPSAAGPISRQKKAGLL